MSGWDGIFELMSFNLKLFDAMFSGQGALAPSFPTLFDFFPSISQTTTLFATTYRSLFPELARLLDATEILAFLSCHAARPIDIKDHPSRIDTHDVANWNACRGGQH
jgi:hypothetical protein